MALMAALSPPPSCLSAAPAFTARICKQPCWLVVAARAWRPVTCCWPAVRRCHRGTPAGDKPTNNVFPPMFGQRLAADDMMENNKWERTKEFRERERANQTQNGWRGPDSIGQRTANDGTAGHGHPLLLGHFVCVGCFCHRRRDFDPGKVRQMSSI
jgi:hypothetical protein